MSDIEQIFRRVHELIDRLEPMLPPPREAAAIDSCPALRWQHDRHGGRLVTVPHPGATQLDDLLCIERQKQQLIRNTRQFLRGLPANNVLLWGPRGTGKSSLIKALLNAFQGDGLRLIEVERQHMADLRAVCELVQPRADRFIVYCDDLSFEADDPSYKALKVVLDGSVSATPENMLIYATSNRRHLMPEYMSENRAARMVEGELHLSESTEEKISLSERFGIWLAFHPCNQDQYLDIVGHWVRRLGGPPGADGALRQAALRWALEHGSRSGRTAWQFARDWTGSRLLDADGVD